MKAPQVIAFDCYGTIIDFDDDGFIAAMAEIAQAQGMPVDGVTLWERFLEAARALRDDGKRPAFLPYREAWARQFEMAWRVLGFAGDGAAASDYLRRCLAQATVYPETKPVLAALRPHYRLALLSNADDDFLLECLQRNGLDSEFEAMVSSEAAGATKPAPAIFHRLAEALAVPPAAVIYAGDNPQSDVVGARQAGLAVAWVNRRGAALPAEVPPPDVEVRTLTELAMVLLAPAEGGSRDC